MFIKFPFHTQPHFDSFSWVKIVMTCIWHCFIISSLVIKKFLYIQRNCHCKNILKLFWDHTVAYTNYYSLTVQKKKKGKKGRRMKLWTLAKNTRNCIFNYLSHQQLQFESLLVLLYIPHFFFFPWQFPELVLYVCDFVNLFQVHFCWFGFAYQLID